MEEKNAVLEANSLSTAEEPVSPAEVPAVKKAGKTQKPHVALRILLQLLSLILSLSLLVGVLSAALVADLRRVTAKEGIKQIIVTLLQGPAKVRPAAGAAGIRPDSTSTRDSSEAQNMLVDMALEMLENMELISDEIPEEAIRAEVEGFLEESTVVDFLTDKVAGYTSDYLTGEALTTITPEEIRQLVEENKEVIQNRFGIEITQEQTDAIVSIAEEAGIDTIVRQEVFESISSKPLGDADKPALPDESTGTEIPQNLTVGELVQILQQISSDSVMYTTVAICAALVLLLLLCNFYSIPGGLGWASAPTIFAGLLLSLPIFWIQGNPETLAMLVNGETTVANVISGVASTIAPVHVTVLGIGIALAVASIAARIVRAAVRKKHAA